jgi:ubiquinone/menaquinone biosynthesis C-methylase UbiE
MTRHGGWTAEQRLARVMNDLIARAPWLWPLMRAPMRRIFERLAPGYDERTNAGSAEYLAAFAAATARIEGEPERILDIGCGTGVGALFLAREFPRASVRGIDLSEEMIREARSKVGLDPEGRIAFKVADAADLPYEDESFDLVAQLNMPPFFDEMVRVLRPGGHAIVATSWADETPFFTPAAVLARGFQKRGLVTAGDGETGVGSYYVARKPGTA